MKSQERKLSIRFTGRTAEEHKVPVAVLNQVLSGLQRAVHLLAMQVENIEIRQRERISEKISDKYVLLCEPPQPGSLLIAASLGDRTSDFFAEEDIESVATNLDEFSRAIQNKDNETVQRIMPNRNRRKCLIDALEKTIPKGSSGINVQVGWNGSPFISSHDMRLPLREFMLPIGSKDEIRTVTGRLVRIDFDERKVTIHYKPTDTVLECYYEESAEEMLLDRPRELIQVTGVVRLDEKDLPKKIVKVETIRELDLSRFYREFVNFPKYSLRFNPPLVIEPQLIEEEQLICLCDPELGIDIFAPSIEELEFALDTEIEMLWHYYAEADDADLSPKAQELKKHLLRRIQQEDRQDG